MSQTHLDPEVENEGVGVGSGWAWRYEPSGDSRGDVSDMLEPDVIEYLLSDGLVHDLRASRSSQA